MRRQLTIIASALCLATVWLAALTLSAQGRGRVRVTPRAMATGEVDGVKISIEYGSPYKRNRVIWGGLVPWNRWWMPGADESSTITTSAALLVGTLQMPAGDHTIYTLPRSDEFLLIINKQTGQFHTQYNQSRDLGRVPMNLTHVASPVEQMTFAITPNPSGGGKLSLTWDDREYAVSLRKP